MGTRGQARRIGVLGWGLAVWTTAAFVLAGVASAGVTWDPADTARVLNRPRTCNTPTSTCTDSWYTYAENGPAFAVSNDGATHYLHAVWFTDRFGDASSSWANYNASCSPNCAGVYYARSADGGATWDGGTVGTDAQRVGPTSITTQRGAIAASGSYVYVAYVTTEGYWDRMCANTDRLLYVAVNSNYGSGAWTTVALTSSGRVDFPSIAASGSTVSVIHTDSTTGQMIYDRSTDNGTTFTPQGIGWTTNTYDNLTSPGSPRCASPPSPSGLEGYDGAPAIATDGTTVAAAWIGTPNGRVKAKVSTDGGVSWPGGGNGQACSSGTGVCTQHLADSGAIGPVSNNPATARGTVSVAGLAGRFAFSWKDNVGRTVPRGIYVREFTTSGGWGAPRLVSCLQTSSPCSVAPAAPIYNDASATSVALYGTTGVAVAWGACPSTPTAPRAPCDNQRGGRNADPGAEILFKESWDDGVNWWAGVPGSYQRVAANTASNSQVNEFPTLVYDKPGAATTGCAMGVQGPEVGCVRYVYFTGRSVNFFDYAMYLATGTQTP
jgi:hypothetical protein